MERHLKRLAELAEYFDFSASGRSAEGGKWLGEIRAELEVLSFNEPKRIRLLLSKGGAFEVQTFSIGGAQASAPVGGQRPPLHVVIAKEPVDSGDVFLYHKTTNRAVYESAFAKATADKKADDVLLYNPIFGSWQV